MTTEEKITLDLNAYGPWSLYFLLETAYKHFYPESSEMHLMDFLEQRIAPLTEDESLELIEKYHQQEGYAAWMVELGYINHY